MGGGSWRAADGDRELVVSLLAEHCATGRLSMIEFEDRTALAYGAKTYDDLDRCLADLPALPALRTPPPVERPSRPRTGLRRPFPAWVTLAAAAVAFVIGQSDGDDAEYYGSPADASFEEGPSVTGPPLPAPGPLPVPGLEQPADLAAAEAGVRASYSEAFSASNDRLMRAAAVEGGALDAAYDEAAANFPEQTATVSVTTRGIVFVSPTEAVLDYELFYSGGPTLGPAQGRSVFVDGRWKVARDTVCGVLTIAGATSC